MPWACRHPWAPASQAGCCLCQTTEVAAGDKSCCSAVFWPVLPSGSSNVLSECTLSARLQRSH